MFVFRLLPVIFSMVLLSTHFYRGGHLLLASGALLSLGLLCIRRPPAVWLLQGLLGAGTAEWLATAVRLAMFRQSQGLPWQRLAIILGLVALGTLLSTLVFRRENLRIHYNLPRKKQLRP
ncbi:hypothetical protein [Thiovibrio frasassiensis]|uniref:Uncharacterized protein n=1 Tax=Thiovibrio frasassiensis TaxID=2984131 RepID=A0A9X4MIC0_9BACT|nr:hypothetical protein [Thiovibrio frasassiensis]MDG4476891.1 hypothetical protein [Thiovibrio frasassiensis]